MFSFLFKTTSKKDQNLKQLLKKELFNPARHKKIVTQAARKSAEDQQKVLIKYRDRVGAN
jgi:hypothetical protein